MTRLVHVTTTDMSLDWLLGPQLEAFAAAGYEVIGMSAPGPHVAALAERGITHVPLAHATRAMAPVEDAAALEELRQRFRELRPDIVHTHNPKPGIYGRLAARLAGVPVVVNTVHGLYATVDDPLRRRAVVYGLERVAAACSGAELLQNPEDLPVLRRLGVPEHRLVLLGNGIDLRRFDRARVRHRARAEHRAALGIGDDEVLVGLVGRLVREKGYGDVVAAAARLAEREVPVRFVVIGPDDPDKPDALRADDRAAAEALGVTFLGRRDDVEELYAAMDLYALASWREGYPRSAMEAAAMGLPIVATDVRGCRQVVVDGATGLLVAPHRPKALARAIEELAVDPARRARMSGAARRLAEREFDQERVIERTLAAYERLGAPPRLAAREP